MLKTLTNKTFSSFRSGLNLTLIAFSGLGTLVGLVAIVDGATGLQKFFQLLIEGIGLGVIYALIALGYVVIYKSVGMFNFTQGGLVLLGAYLSVQFINGWSIPFFLGILFSAISMAAIGGLIERVVIRPMIGKPIYTTVLVTLGLLLAISQIVPSIWSETSYILIPPWEGNTSTVFGVLISHAHLWNILIVVVLLILFWLLFQFTNLGLSMRAIAVSQEISAGQGINVGLAFSISWMIAGVIGSISGTLLIFESGGALTVALAFVALRAFPAMILGGLDSIAGTVVAGVLLGIIELFTRGYIDFEWLGGNSFSTVVPYVVMVAVLLWRPEGLFGTKQVQRL